MTLIIPTAGHLTYVVYHTSRFPNRWPDTREVILKHGDAPIRIFADAPLREVLIPIADVAVTISDDSFETSDHANVKISISLRARPRLTDEKGQELETEELVKCVGIFGTKREPQQELSHTLGVLLAFLRKRTFREIVEANRRDEAPNGSQEKTLAQQVEDKATELLSTHCMNIVRDSCVIGCSYNQDELDSSKSAHIPILEYLNSYQEARRKLAQAKHDFEDQLKEIEAAHKVKLNNLAETENDIARRVEELKNTQAAHLKRISDAHAAAIASLDKAEQKRIQEAAFDEKKTTEEAKLSEANLARDMTAREKEAAAEHSQRLAAAHEKELLAQERQSKADENKKQFEHEHQLGELRRAQALNLNQITQQIELNEAQQKLPQQADALALSFDQIEQLKSKQIELDIAKVDGEIEKLALDRSELQESRNESRRRQSKLDEVAQQLLMASLEKELLLQRDEREREHVRTLVDLLGKHLTGALQGANGMIKEFRIFDGSGLGRSGALVQTILQAIPDLSSLLTSVSSSLGTHDARPVDESPQTPQPDPSNPRESAIHELAPSTSSNPDGDVGRANRDGILPSKDYPGADKLKHSSVL